jgi:DNA-binding winged helix-turn-helix (wHTH) protein
MTATKQKFHPLLALPDPWAIRSGLPKETVLRRLTEWAMCDAFPKGAFRDIGDVSICPFDIYMSFRAAFQNAMSDNAVHLGSSTIYSPLWGIDVLRKVLISSTDIEAFCEKVDVEPPWQRYETGWFFRTKARLRQFLAPPACPEAEPRAIRHDAGTSAEYRMNSMRTLLDSLMGKPRKSPFRPVQLDGGPIDFEFWGKRWDDHHDFALAHIAESQNPTLHERLRLLTNEWEQFQSSHRASSDQISSPAGTEVRPSLRLYKSQGVVLLNGKEFPVADKPFQLLFLLSERAQQGKEIVKKRDIERHLWGEYVFEISREVSDVVRELREALTEGSDLSGKELIANRHGQGYRLELSPSAIFLEP